MWGRDLRGTVFCGEHGHFPFSALKSHLTEKRVLKNKVNSGGLTPSQLYFSSSKCFVSFFWGGAPLQGFGHVQRDGVHPVYCAFWGDCSKE